MLSASVGDRRSIVDAFGMETPAGASSESQGEALERILDSAGIANEPLSGHKADESFARKHSGSVEKAGLEDSAGENAGVSVGTSDGSEFMAAGVEMGA